MAVVGWVRLLGVFCFVFAANSLFGAPSIPESIPVTVLVKSSPLIRPRGASIAPPKQTYNELPGVLYTRINSIERERLGAPPLRIMPLVKYGQKEQLSLDWVDGDSIAIAWDRMRSKNGILSFETADGTWALGAPVGIRVKEGEPHRIYLSVRHLELVDTLGGTGIAKSRILDIELEDVSNRVWSVPRHMTAATALGQSPYFLSADGEALLPVTILGFENNSAWVCSSHELESGNIKSVRLLLIKAELLRRAPVVELSRTLSEAGRKTIPLEWLASFVQRTAEIPPHTASRLSFVKQTLEKKRPDWKPEITLTRKSCALNVAQGAPNP